MMVPGQIWQKIVDALFPSGRRAEALYAAAVAQARRPAFYADWGVPDTPEGRFEMITLHVILLLDRLMQLAATEPEAGELARELQERLFDELDASLREMGVSDLAVPKRMRRLAAAVYERMRAYRAALEHDDAVTLKEALRRYIYAASEASAPMAGMDTMAAAEVMAEYALQVRDGLRTVALRDLQAGQVPWPQASAGSLDEPDEGS